MANRSTIIFLGLFIILASFTYAATPYYETFENLNFTTITPTYPNVYSYIGSASPIYYAKIFNDPAGHFSYSIQKVNDTKDGSAHAFYSGINTLDFTFSWSDEIMVMNMSLLPYNLVVKPNMIFEADMKKQQNMVQVHHFIYRFTFTDDSYYDLEFLGNNPFRYYQCYYMLKAQDVTTTWSHFNITWGQLGNCSPEQNEIGSGFAPDRYPNNNAAAYHYINKTIKTLTVIQRSNEFNFPYSGAYLNMFVDNLKIDYVKAPIVHIEDFEDHNMTYSSYTLPVTYIGSIENPIINAFRSTYNNYGGGASYNLGYSTSTPDGSTKSNRGRVDLTGPGTVDLEITMYSTTLPEPIFINENFTLSFAEKFYSPTAPGGTGTFKLVLGGQTIYLYREASPQPGQCDWYVSNDNTWHNLTTDIASMEADCQTLLLGKNFTTIQYIVGHMSGAGGIKSADASIDNLEIRGATLSALNSMPSISFWTVNDTSLVEGDTLSMDITASDPESNTISYAIDCDYPLGGSVPFDTLSTKTCTFVTPGDYNIGLYVTDNIHPTSYSSYQVFPVSVSALPFCGDLSCNNGETYGTCPGDCPASCGDLVCNGGETCSSCPGDCGNCGGGGGGGGGNDEPDLKQCPAGQTCLPVCSPGTDYDFNYVDNFITDYQDVEVPNYLQEKTKAETCGIDADQDGYKCDGNEDFISCPKDCAVNVADLLCYDRCMWTEEWFIQSAVIFETILALYFIILLI